MRVAIYTRVSTQEQVTNGYSIDEQEVKAKKYCEALGWTVYKVYRDGGYSGANMDRPALKQMIRDAEHGKFNKVLVFKLDRLSRSQLDTLYLVEKVFLNHGVDFISMSENFDTSSPFGKAMIGILAVFAQLERDQIKERMSMGWEARAKEGKFHGSGAVPIGYDYDHGELTINDFEAMQVRKAHELYLSGMGCQAICDYFNGAGMTHRFGKWYSNTLRNVLANKTYIGYTKYHDEWYKGSHEPILSDKLYNDVKALKDAKHDEYLKHNRRYGMATSYFGGFCYCARCGAKYIKSAEIKYKGDKRYYYAKYKCSSRAKKTKASIIDPNCRNKIWRMEELDNILLGEIKKLRLEPIQSVTRQSDAPIIQQEIEKLDSQIEKLMELYSVGNIPIDKLKDKIDALDDQRTKLENTMQEEPRLSRAEAIDYANALSDIIETGSLGEIRTLIGTLIDRIVLDGDDITIYWNFD